jgi:DNA-binding transcriptional LysR family regulator
MAWDAIKFDWNHIRAFLAVAETGSLSAAARRLGQTQPTVGRQVAALESDLDVLLFDRDVRGMRLTPAGADMLDHVNAMAQAAAQVSQVAQGHGQTATGLVRLAVSDTMAAYILPPILPPILTQIRAEAPGIEFELVVSNEVTDLRRRDADIALRHLRPTQGDLIARKIAETSAAFYATSSYAAGLPDGDGVTVLGAAQILGFDEPARMVEAFKGCGIATRIEQFAVTSSSAVAVWELARAGAGVAIMTREIAAKFPEMVQIAPDLPPVPIPLWLVSHREIQHSARIRTVFDALARALTGVLAGE